MDRSIAARRFYEVRSPVASYGADVIVLPPGVYVLDAVDNTAFGNTGLPAITATLILSAGTTDRRSQSTSCAVTGRKPQTLTCQ